LAEEIFVEPNHRVEANFATLQSKVKDANAHWTFLSHGPGIKQSYGNNFINFLEYVKTINNECFFFVLFRSFEFTNMANVWGRRNLYLLANSTEPLYIFMRE
jgi:hypothetical protein